MAWKKVDKIPRDFIMERSFIREDGAEVFVVWSPSTNKKYMIVHLRGKREYYESA